MRKYVEIIKIYFKAKLIWRFDVIGNLLVTFTKILFASILWRAIFEGKEEVGGFTLGAMLSYYLIQGTLTTFDKSREISTNMSQQIRGGTFSKNMVLPVNILGYYGAKTIGSALLNIVFSLVTALLWIIIFKIRFVINSNIEQLGAVGLMFLLGYIFMIQFNYFLGLLTFKFNNISTFLMLESNILELICGGIIPLVFLPEVFINLFKVLPFYYTSYLPAMLFIGQGGEEAVFGLGILALWIILFIPINYFLYQRLRVKYDGVGI